MSSRDISQKVCARARDKVDTQQPLEQKCVQMYCVGIVFQKANIEVQKKLAVIAVSLL